MSYSFNDDTPIYTQIIDLNLKIDNSYVGLVEMEKGFIDEENNFLNPKEAFNEAYECNQINKERLLKKVENQDFELKPEDLWS